MILASVRLVTRDQLLAQSALHVHSMTRVVQEQSVHHQSDHLMPPTHIFCQTNEDSEEQAHNRHRREGLPHRQEHLSLISNQHDRDR